MGESSLNIFTTFQILLLRHFNVTVIQFSWLVNKLTSVNKSALMTFFNVRK